MKSSSKSCSRLNRRINNRKSSRSRLTQQRLACEPLEDRRLLAADVMTFDGGTTTPTSHSEAGMTVATIDATDFVWVNDVSSNDTDSEFIVDSGKYGPMEFALDSGGSFTLNSLEVDGIKGGLLLTASSGETATLTSAGVHAFPTSGWTNITSFQVSTDQVAYIDNLVFEVGTSAADDSVAIDEDTASVSVDVLDNDGVDLGGTLVIDAVSSPGNGSAFIDDNSTPTVSDDDQIIYSPNPDFFGTDTFTYTVSDGLGGTDSATVTVTVGPINDAPVVDLNGSDGAGIDFGALFTGSATEIADADASLFDVDGGITTSGDAIYVVNAKGEIIQIDSATGDQTSIGNSGALIDRPGHLVVDPDTDSIYVVDAYDSSGRQPEIVQVDPVTGAETSIGFYGTPGSIGLGIDMDDHGNLVVNHRRSGWAISKIDPTTGNETLIAQSSSRRMGGLAVEADGSILQVASPNLYRIDPVNGSISTLSSGGIVRRPVDVDVDANGNVFLMGSTNSRTYVIAQVDAVSGGQTLLTNTTKGQTSLAVDSAGDPVFIQRNSTETDIIEVDASNGSQSLIASGNLLDSPSGIDLTAVTTAGDIISSLSVAITNQLDGASEILSADTAGTNVTASYDAGIGTLSLVGADTASTYEAVLRTITYENTAPQPDATTRVLEVIANDGVDESQVAVATIVMNRPPVADAGGPYSVPEGGTLGLDASDSMDPDQSTETLEYQWDLDGDGIFGETGAAAGRGDETGISPTFDASDLDGNPTANVTVDVMVTDDFGASETAQATISIENVAPTVEDATIEVVENSASGTIVLTIVATDPGNDTLTYSPVGGSGELAFSIDSSSGEITVADDTLLDYESTTSFTLDVEVDDGDGGTDIATITIDLLNQASITGVVYVDVNQNGSFDANESGIDGVTVELLDSSGAPVLDEAGDAITAVTSDGGYYLFEDLDPGDYQLFEVQPTGVDDGAEALGSLMASDHAILANDKMQLTLNRVDAFDYAFAEIGQQVAAGDTATIGFWHNKHGQALIATGGTALAEWLTTNFDNVFGDTFDGASGDDVADFFRTQLFKQKGKKNAGPAKVDAQFMAVAFATYFTSSNLAGNAAGSYGFNVTDTGIGTNIVNVGANGAAFNVADNTDLTILQLLQTTNAMTDTPDHQDGSASIYDQDGDGHIDEEEAALRAMANEIFSMINEGGDI